MRDILTIRLPFWIPALTLIGASFIAVIGIYSTYRGFSSDLVDSSYRLVARDLADLQREMQLEMTDPQLRTLGQALAARGVDTRYRLIAAIDAEGRIVQATRRALLGKHADAVLEGFSAEKLTEVQRSHGANIGIADGDTVIAAYLPFRYPVRPNSLRDYAHGGIYALFDLSADRTRLWHETITRAWPIAFYAIAFAALLSYVARRFAVEPLMHLSSVVNSIAEGDSGNRARIVGSGVIRGLSDGINSMIDQLQQRFEERNRAEAELRDRELDLRTTINSIGDAVLATDAEGRIRRLNPVAEKLTGWGSDEAAGRAVSEVFDIVDGETGDRASNPVKEVLATGKMVELANNTLLIARSGQSSQIADSAAPICDEHGNITGVVLVFRDVSDAYRIREQLKSSEERLRHVASVANEGVWDWHMGADERVEFDPRYFTMAGYEVGEFPPAYEQWLQRLHPDDREATEQAVRDYLAGRTERYDIQFRFRRKDDGYMWIRARGKVVERDVQGAPLRFIGTHADIDEQKETEAILRRTQRMEAVGQLTGGIAHDFNNLLGIICGNMELLRSYDGFDDRVLKRLDAIDSAAGRAVDLTRQLLGVSRGQENRPEVADINEVITEMGELVQRSLTPDIDSQFELEKSLWKTSIDVGEFQDCLLNLFINARDAMSGRGSVRVTTRNVTLDARFCAAHPEAEPGEYVEVAISDTGSGIPLDQQERVFEPFYSTKPVGKGTGLGLAQVFGFVRRNGGVLNLISAPGEGTTFQLFFPRVEGCRDGPGVEPESADTLAVGQGLVLVVDDEPALLELASLMLEQLGYQIIAAGDGRSALELLNNHPVDLLLSDVVMPGGMSGYELAIAAIEINPEIKILLTSGFTGEQQIDQQLMQRFGTPLEKPYSHTELSRRIDELLSGSATS